MQEIRNGGRQEALTWLINNAPEFESIGETYATAYGWTEGTGVWVLEGTRENHEAFNRAYDEIPSLSRNEALEKAGTIYYEHCK